MLIMPEMIGSVRERPAPAALAACTPSHSCQPRALAPLLRRWLTRHALALTAQVVGVHNGKVFTSVEVKADMVGMYLGEFSISYKPVRHGRPGIGATSSSKFVPLK